VADNQNTDADIGLAEKKIVGKPPQVGSLKAADPLVEMPWVFGDLQNLVQKFVVKIIGKPQVRDILVIFHDRVDFGQDAGMKHHIHRVRRL